MTYICAEFWAVELPETCRVSWQKWIWEIIRSVGFIKKEICYDARSRDRKTPYDFFLTKPKDALISLI